MSFSWLNAMFTGGRDIDICLQGRIIMITSIWLAVGHWFWNDCIIRQPPSQVYNIIDRLIDLSIGSHANEIYLSIDWSEPEQQGQQRICKVNQRIMGWFRPLIEKSQSTLISLTQTHLFPFFFYANRGDYYTAAMETRSRSILVVGYKA